ncbi:MAG: alpha/beta hydrolase [Patescibacteria group bacterium]
MEKIIGGIKTHCKIFGKGKPFLILHGWGSNSERWKEVAEIIAKNGFLVVIPDLPGFGQSDVPQFAWGTDDYVKWVEKFLKTQKVLNKGFYLAGHSFGGSLATLIAIKHPQKIKKLFLVASAAIRKKTYKKTVVPEVAKFLKNFKDVPLYGLARKVFYKYIVRRSDYLNVKESMKGTYLKIIAQDLSGFLPKIKVPTIIIWGERDSLTLVEDAYFTNKKIKNSKLIIIPGAEHDLNRKQPETLAKEILNNI